MRIMQDGPLCTAINAENPELAKELIIQGTKINVFGCNGVTPLYLAVYNEYYDVAKLLLENGADPNLRIDGQSTPMHAAAMTSIEFVALLLKNGADINAVDEDGTPLDAAIALRKHDVIQYLKEHGAVST